MKMKPIFLFLIFAIILLASNHFYNINHTMVEIKVVNTSEKCSPEIFLEIKRLGVENVVTSCLIKKDPFMASCTSKKLISITKLDPICSDFSGGKRWIVTLYGKHTPFYIPKIELINETLK